MEYIYGPGGIVLGYIHKSGSAIRGERVDVYDSTGMYRGWTDDTGTYDDTGYQISTSKMPGLLLSNQDGTRCYTLFEYI
jgi:hypothetical protein